MMTKQYSAHIRTRTARAYNHIVTLRSFSADHSLISVEYTKKETIAVPKIERNKSTRYTTIFIQLRNKNCEEI